MAEKELPVRKDLDSENQSQNNESQQNIEKDSLNQRDNDTDDNQNNDQDNQNNDDQKEQTDQKENSAIDQQNDNNPDTNDKNENFQDQDQQNQDNQQADAPNTDERKIMFEELSDNFRRNKLIVDKFLEKFHQDVYNYFSDFSREKDGGPPLVNATDVPLVMRVAFYIDNITFHADQNDNDEFFNRPNSYKTIMEILTQFVSDQQNIQLQDLDINNVKLNYDQFVDFVSFLLKKNQDLFLTHGSDAQWNQDQQIKDSPIVAEIKANIEKYSKMLDEHSQTEQEKQVLINTIAALQKQLDQLTQKDKNQSQILNSQNQQFSRLDGKSKSYSRARLTKEQLRQKHLQEIYEFYCKQQYSAGVQYTFDRVEHERNVINIGKFMLFCKQFHILGANHKLSKQAIPGIFKKVSANSKELTKYEFRQILEKISSIMYADDETLPNEFDKLEAFYKFIELDDKAALLQKMKLLHTPFKIKVADGFRLLPWDVNRDIKLRKIPQNVREMIDKKKQERSILLSNISQIDSQPSNMVSPNSYMKPGLSMSQQNQRSRIGGHHSSTPNLQQYQRLQQQQNQPSQFQQQTQNKPYMLPSNDYTTLGQKHKIQQMDKFSKVSWEQLEKITASDLNLMKNESFKPTDLFEEQDDDEDRIFLAEYNLAEEQRIRQERAEQLKKSQFQYGVIEDKLRPTQKYLLKNDPNYGKKGYKIENKHKRLGQGKYSQPQYDINLSDDNYDQPNQRGNYPASVKGGNSQIGLQYKQRAQQIGEQERQRDKAMMDNIMMSQESKVNRGINAANRYYNAKK